MQQKENLYGNLRPDSIDVDHSRLFEGTYYVDHID